MTTSKKITKATVKSFVKANSENLFINVKRSFDGMVDGCVSQHDGFNKAVKQEDCNKEHTMGVKGAWFVGSSRDYFYPYNQNGFTGIEVSNSCGCFILAVKN